MEEQPLQAAGVGVPVHVRHLGGNCCPLGTGSASLLQGSSHRWGSSSYHRCHVDPVHASTGSGWRSSSSLGAIRRALNCAAPDNCVFDDCALILFQIWFGVQQAPRTSRRHARHCFPQYPFVIKSLNMFVDVAATFWLAWCSYPFGFGIGCMGSRPRRLRPPQVSR